ncbi:hypothetical protein QUF64_15415 [Anaerolineales bacterium HSG6]|nr:hypothetical protein [Anaerolineales bacterium HSG6]MDM8530889.1 hypothetical protein [Anaerolineales bacterium HSG25]
MSDLSLNPVYLSARAAIVAPERALSTSLYGIQKWLPRLGSERWCLILLLRSLCVDSPRQNNGTKQVVCSLQELANALSIHKRTLLRWFKHKPIPNDKPWRAIIPHDEKAKYLALFIPRLRYAYETRQGKGKRVGFVMEILMEDPVVPEDEIKLKQQVELIQTRQGSLNLETYRPINELAPQQIPPESSPMPESLNRQPDTSPRRVNGQNDILDNNIKSHYDTLHHDVNGQSVHSESLNRQNSASQQSIKGQNVDSHISANRQFAASDEPVNRQIDTLAHPSNSTTPLHTTQNEQFVTSEKPLEWQNVDSDPSLNRQNSSLQNPLNRQSVGLDQPVNRQSDTLSNGMERQTGTLPPKNEQFVTSESVLNSQNVTLLPGSVNVNQLYLLFKDLNTKTNNVNSPETKLFEPIVTLTEKLLDDTHSTGMLYKRLKTLYPDNFELYVQAVQTALEVAETKPKANKGAIFVRTLSRLANNAQIDLNRSTPAPASSPTSSSSVVKTNNLDVGQQLDMPISYQPEPVSLEQLVWEETKQALQGQMTQATYVSVIHGTTLLLRDGNYFLVGVPTESALAWLNHRYINTIQQTLTSVIGEPAVVEFNLIRRDSR